MIPLDHAYSAQRLCEPAGHLGIDLAALPENRPDRRERFIECNAKTDKRSDGNQRHLWTGTEQQNESNAGGDKASSKVHQSGPQKVAYPFHVAHDAGYQTASLVGVVKSNWQARDVGLYLLAQFGDQALRRFG